MNRKITLSIFAGALALFVSTEANALCNLKLQGVCHSASLANGLTSDCSARCAVGFIGEGKARKRVTILYDKQDYIPKVIDLRKKKRK